MANSLKRQIKIPFFTIIKIVFVLLLFYVAYLTLDILALLFIAFILFSALTPWIDKLEDYRIPRFLSVLTIYLFLFLIIISIFVFFAPIFLSQVKDLLSSIPGYWDKIFLNNEKITEFSVKYGLSTDFDNFIRLIQQNIGKGIQGVFWILVSIFGGLASFLIVLVIAFYMIVEKNSLDNFLGDLIPKKYKKEMLEIIEKVQEKLGAWFRAQLFLSFIIFILTLIFLSIFKIKYALILAIIAGFTELIPYLGPTLGAVPAVLLAFLDEPFKALIVIFIYVGIQQFENTVLVPQVMKKAVGLSPVVSILALMAGFKIGAALGIGSVLGGILAIPLVVTLSIIINEVFKYKEA